jgi:hypothetical protein
LEATILSDETYSGSAREFRRMDPFLGKSIIDVSFEGLLLGWRQIVGSLRGRKVRRILKLNLQIKFRVLRKVPTQVRLMKISA